jgi:nitroimidazol reductase NimA-like FMN-containing flavoprotein (pyridoxamine 5'-phosphate oxidase superfamily)
MGMSHLMTDDIDATARRIIDSNRYMTLGTADASGRPWVSPVWYAKDGYGAFLWVSRPGTRHSLNLGDRPEVSVVIFDSTVPIGTGTAVYMSGSAKELDGNELERGIEVFSERSLADGASAWSLGDVTGSAELRLYRAEISECFLGESDRRQPVSDRFLTEP